MSWAQVDWAKATATSSQMRWSKSTNAPSGWFQNSKTDGEWMGVWLLWGWHTTRVRIWPTKMWLSSTRFGLRGTGGTVGKLKWNICKRGRPTEMRSWLANSIVVCISKQHKHHQQGSAGQQRNLTVSPRLHKRRLQKASDNPHTQQDAEMAVGLTTER